MMVPSRFFKPSQMIDWFLSWHDDARRNPVQCPCFPRRGKNRNMQPTGKDATPLWERFVFYIVKKPSNGTKVVFSLSLLLSSLSSLLCVLLFLQLFISNTNGGVLDNQKNLISLVGWSLLRGRTRTSRVCPRGCGGGLLLLA